MMKKNMKTLRLGLCALVVVSVAGCMTQNLGEKIFLGLAVPQEGNPKSVKYMVPVDKTADTVFRALLSEGGTRVISAERKETVKTYYERNQKNELLDFFEFKYLTLFLSQAQVFTEIAPKELIKPCLAERTQREQMKACDENVMSYMQKSDKEYHAGLSRWIVLMEKAGIKVDEKHRKIILAPLRKTE